jgi:hypothetical protein
MRNDLNQSATANLRRKGFRLPNWRRGRCPPPQTHIDRGGWTPSLEFLACYNTEACEEKVRRKKGAAMRWGGNLRMRLPRISDRRWGLGEMDLFQLVAKNDKERFKALAVVNETFGVSLISHIVAAHGRSLRWVDVRRNNLQIVKETVALIGRVARETSVEALFDIMRLGVRNDLALEERGGRYWHYGRPLQRPSQDAKPTLTT